MSYILNLRGFEILQDRSSLSNICNLNKKEKKKCEFFQYCPEPLKLSAGGML